jgi:hypothetical protein
MLFVDDEVPSKGVLLNIFKLHKLKVFKYPTAWQPNIDLDWISKSLSGLTHLHLRSDGRPIMGSLRLPNLHTLETVFGPGDLENSQEWELPSLRYLSSTNSSALLSVIRQFGHQLEGLQLTLTNSLDNQDSLWSLCPNLQILGFDDISSVVRSSCISKPPIGHPLKAIFITIRKLDRVALPHSSSVSFTIEALTSWNVEKIYMSMEWCEYQRALENISGEKLQWWVDVTRVIESKCREHDIEFLDVRFHSFLSPDGQRLASFIREQK